MAEPARELERFRVVATELDARWRLPGTPIRFGWDAVVGLVPGLGDALAGLVGSYGLYVGWRLGAPTVVLARVLLNLGVETLVGSVPIAGDLFDIAFRGNLRNLALLDRWVARPHETARRSRWLFIGLFAGMLGILLAALSFAIWLLKLLLFSGR